MGFGFSIVFYFFCLLHSVKAQQVQRRNLVWRLWVFDIEDGQNPSMCSELFTLRWKLPPKCAFHVFCDCSDNGRAIRCELGWAQDLIWLDSLNTLDANSVSAWPTIYPNSQKPCPYLMLLPPTGSTCPKELSLEHMAFSGELCHNTYDGKQLKDGDCWTRDCNVCWAWNFLSISCRVRGSERQPVNSHCSPSVSSNDSNKMFIKGAACNRFLLFLLLLFL